VKTPVTEQIVKYSDRPVWQDHLPFKCRWLFYSMYYMNKLC